jgi:hypothetical protein
MREVEKDRPVDRVRACNFTACLGTGGGGDGEGADKLSTSGNGGHWTPPIRTVLARGRTTVFITDCCS